MAQRIPVDVVELLLGHNGYLADSYVRYSIDELRQYYLQAEGAVCGGVADGVAEAIVGEDLNALREENEALRAELSQIRQEIARDRNAVARAEEAIRLARESRNTNSSSRPSRIPMCSRIWQI